MKTGCITALIFIVIGAALMFYGERVASFGLLEALSGLFLLVVGVIIGIVFTIRIFIRTLKEDDDDE